MFGLKSERSNHLNMEVRWHNNLNYLYYLMIAKKKYYIQEVEKMLGVNRKTLFVWESTGKVPKAKREPMSNYRYWSEADIKKLKRIIRVES